MGPRKTRDLLLLFVASFMSLFVEYFSLLRRMVMHRGVRHINLSVVSHRLALHYLRMYPAERTPWPKNGVHQVLQRNQRCALFHEGDADSRFACRRTDAIRRNNFIKNPLD